MAQKVLKGVKILEVKHAGVSRVGNSFYEIATSQGTFKTAQNGTASSQVKNSTSIFGDSSSLNGEIVALRLTGRGTVGALLNDKGEYI